MNLEPPQRVCTFWKTEESCVPPEILNPDLPARSLVTTHTELTLHHYIKHTSILIFYIIIHVPCIFYCFALWPTKAQLFHKLSHSYMFRRYHVILRQLVINTLPSFTSISNAAVGRVQLKCDGTRWCRGGEVKEKLANVVGSQYSSHYLGTWCIQHYYRWCADLGCQ
jgi:hypothetical protein